MYHLQVAQCRQDFIQEVFHLLTQQVIIVTQYIIANYFRLTEFIISLILEVMQSVSISSNSKK